jgi:Type II CAAX prenyl endopeptidase Rce1-like
MKIQLDTIKTFIRMHIVTELIGLIGGLCTGIVILLSGYDASQNANSQISYLPLGLLLFVIILVPLIEEIGFRLALTPKRVYIGVTLTFFVWQLLQFIDGFFGTNILGFTEGLSLTAELAIVSALSLWVGFLMRMFVPKDISLSETQFTKLNYISASIFAYMHIANYGQIGEVPWFVLLLVIPQFLLGLRFGLIRRRLGFMYAYVSHMLHNLVFILPTLVLVRVFSLEELEQIASFDFSPIQGLSLENLALFVLASFFLNFIVTLFVAVGICIYVYSKREKGETLSRLELHMYNLAVPGVLGLYRFGFEGVRKLLTLNAIWTTVFLFALSVPTIYTEIGYFELFAVYSLTGYGALLWASYTNSLNKVQ